MSDTSVSSESKIEKPKFENDSKDQRKQRIRRFSIAGLLVLLVVVPAFLYWTSIQTSQTVELHARWATEAREAGLFEDQMLSIAEEMRHPYFNPNQPLQQFWLGNDFFEASKTLNILGWLDHQSRNQLWDIENSLDRMRGALGGTYFVNLTRDQTAVFANDVQTIGDIVSSAYFPQQGNNVLWEITSGPPISYSGPSFPDEGMLNEAMGLARNPPGVPPL